MKDKKTYILFAALMIGIAVFTVYIQNTMNKEVVLKGVVSTTTTQSEAKDASKDKDKKEDKNTDDTKDKNKNESKDTNKDKDTEKDDPLTSPVTTVPTEEPEVTTTAPQFPMDINYATYEALICVPNIGEKTAESILSFIREKGVISDMDMLLEINGIGEAKLNDLKRYFYVSDVFTVKTTTTTTTTKTSITTSDTTSKSTTAAKQTTPEQTTVSKATTPKETKPPKTTIATTTTPTPMRKKVNINTASADELMACLLIDRTQADEIVAMRGIIGGYTNIHEVLYCESISDSLYAEIDDYLEI